MPSVCWASGRGYQFSPSSVHFKGEISDALPRKRHQKRHLEFCTAYLLSRGSGVRISPGAPFHFFSTTCARSDHLLFRQMVGPPNRWPVFNFSLRFKEFHNSMSSNQRRIDFCHGNVIAPHQKFIHLGAVSPFNQTCICIRDGKYRETCQLRAQSKNDCHE